MGRPGSLILTLAVLVYFCASVSADEVWKEIKGDHFIVYFREGRERFAKDILRKSEEYYKTIATDLGYPRYSEFWLWDNRVKIYIHKDHQAFLKATNQPSWSHGMADYLNKSISSYEWSNEFVISILPHEIAHLIFRDFVGFKGEVPLWMDEGVAQWAEAPKRKAITTMARDLYQRDGMLTVEDMMTVDLKALKKGQVYIRPARTRGGQTGVLFLSIDQYVDLYYIQGVSLVGFLIERYGSERFAHFCRGLRDGKKIDEALKYAYPNFMESINDLEERWREYLSEQ